MANVKLEQSQLQTAMANIEKATSTLNGQLTDIYNEICNAKNAYKTNDSRIVSALESQAELVKGINADYGSCKTSFMAALQSIVASYQEEDTKTTSDVSSLENGEGTQVERPSHVPENATLMEDGRWKSTNENGQTTIYNNNGIEGTPIETDDIRIKALANQMNGGEVVQMADGRIAVRDKNGGGTIFNADGTTEAVSGATVYAGKVNKVTASGNGADPYTQELANEINKAGLSENKTEQLISKFEGQQDSGKVSSDVSVNTDALRDQLGVQGNGVNNDSYYGPAFSPEHNEAVLRTDQEVHAVVDKMNSVDQVTSSGGNTVSNSTPLTSAVDGGSDSSTVTGPLNPKDYGPGFSPEHNAAVLEQVASQGPGDQTVNIVSGANGGGSGSSGVGGNRVLESGPSGDAMTQVYEGNRVDINKFTGDSNSGVNLERDPMFDQLG